MQTNKSRGTSYYRLNLVDGALKQRRFYLDVFGAEIDGIQGCDIRQRGKNLVPKDRG